ncbi:propionyl-CoA synthetase (plasmid) [Arthrobacter sp. StoSoilB3]|nr:propionyl-CoA synthetase [Arthrobacter sp. StoSoilB3]
MHQSSTGAYSKAFAASMQTPEEFWLNAAHAIDWDVAPTTAVDASGAPIFRWFADGKLNTSYNALDRHVLAGRGHATALVYDSPVAGKARGYSYSQLLNLVERFAGVLASQGVTKGDRVVVYMPMIPQAVIAMLACARIGAVHSVVFGGFAAKELASRLDDARPNVVVTASGGIEPSRTVEYLPLLKEALALSKGSVKSVIVKNRPEVPGLASTYDSGITRWLDWDDEMETAEPHGPVSVSATDPLYILYTSGTTGRPKGVVRDNGGHAVALTWSMTNIYDIVAGEVMWTASDVGWVVGHSYIVYGPLFAGATTVLYEGKPVGTPDAGAFWRVIQEHQVKVLFTAPTAFRAIRKADPHEAEVKKYDLSSIKAIYFAGERLDPETYRWAGMILDRPVIDHWWQTETGWAICANPFGLEPLPLRAGSPTKPVPGFDVVILSDAGSVVPQTVEGNIAIKLPLPPGTLATLWNDDQRFVETYLSDFDGYYNTGDSGYFDADGYLFVMGRTDDVINVAGHRLSTGVMEQVVAQHDAVAECAVVGLHDPLKGQKACAFVVLKSGYEVDETQLSSDLAGMIRQQIGPVASFRDVVVVSMLPKTRSGKILRKTISQIADGQDFATPATIEDVRAIQLLADKFQAHA